MSCDEIEAALGEGRSVAGGCFVAAEGDLLQGHVVGYFRCWCCRGSAVVGEVDRRSGEVALEEERRGYLVGLLDMGVDSPSEAVVAVVVAAVAEVEEGPVEDSVPNTSGPDYLKPGGMGYRHCSTDSGVPPAWHPLAGVGDVVEDQVHIEEEVLEAGVRNRAHFPCVEGEEHHAWTQGLDTEVVAHSNDLDMGAEGRDRRRSGC
jgi:hypothetical protein